MVHSKEVAYFLYRKHTNSNSLNDSHIAVADTNSNEKK